MYLYASGGTVESIGANGDIIARYSLHDVKGRNEQNESLVLVPSRADYGRPIGRKPAFVFDTNKDDRFVGALIDSQSGLQPLKDVERQRIYPELIRYVQILHVPSSK